MTRSVFVTASIDLDDISTRELLAELNGRGDHQCAKEVKTAIESFRDSLDELRAAIREGRSHDALVLIDRIFEPRFRDTFDCRERYKRAMEMRA